MIVKRTDEEITVLTEKLMDEIRKKEEQKAFIEDEILLSKNYADIQIFKKNMETIDIELALVKSKLLIIRWLIGGELNE